MTRFYRAKKAGKIKWTNEIYNHDSTNILYFIAHTFSLLLSDTFMLWTHHSKQGSWKRHFGIYSDWKGIQPKGYLESRINDAIRSICLIDTWSVFLSKINLIRGLSSFDFFERGDDKKKKFIKQVYQKKTFFYQNTHTLIQNLCMPDEAVGLKNKVILDQI